VDDIQDFLFDPKISQDFKKVCINRLENKNYNILKKIIENTPKISNMYP
jgi:hypothetical protein